MANPFSAVTHFFGKVAMALVGFVHKADQAVDAAAPEIEKLLQQGASVAQFIPGVGPEVASLLNAGVQLVGDVKAAIDGTDAVLAQAVQQAAALAPAGYSFVLIKSDVQADLKLLLDTWKTQIAAATTTVEAIHPPASVTVPSPASVALADKAPPATPAA